MIAYNEKSRIWTDNEAYSKVFKDETCAAHIIFVFSLLRAIEQRKQELVTRGRTAGQLTQQEMKEMDLHRGPGAQFFLMAVIASCLEVAMDEPIPNRFRFTWRDSNLQNGIARWQPVLQIVLSFGETLAEKAYPFASGDPIHRVVAADPASFPYEMSITPEATE